MYRDTGTVRARRHLAGIGPSHAHLVEGGDLDALDEEALLAALDAAGELRMERGHGRV